MNVELKPGERVDELQRNGYQIIQDPGRFCFGMDAVLLSGFARVKPGERALDLGTGTGIIPILLEARTQGESFTGLEIQEESADMARRSVSMNGLVDRGYQRSSSDLRSCFLSCGDLQSALYDGKSWSAESEGTSGDRAA